MHTYGSSFGSRGDWEEVDPAAVDARIQALAGDPDLEAAREAAEEAANVFDFSKADIASILQSELEERSDGFLEGLKAQVEKLETLSVHEVLERLSPQGQIMTRDAVVLGQGKKVPPQMMPIGEVRMMRHVFAVCVSAADIARKAASHLERRQHRKHAENRIGTNVFIGHGRSMAWRDLKDFLQDRLKLPWDEFNRVPVAGVTNIARLSEMLDAAAVAFLVLTAEDETADGAMHARMNVIHEAGLFQGRLGFTKAVVLLEEGCEQFSNIEGLGQIRFPPGNISAAFEEIRRVLEREELLSSD
ncbi:MAG: nucleotide-binding protein [Pseudomonadales bacterium]